MAASSQPSQAPSADSFEKDILSAVHPTLSKSLSELYGHSVPDHALNQLGKQILGASLARKDVSSLKLYVAPNACPYCWRVDAYVNHFKIPHDLELVDLVKGEQRSPEYLAINPSGLVPALVEQREVNDPENPDSKVIKSHIVTESGAVLIYVDEVFGSMRGRPREPAELGQMWKLVYCAIGNLASYEAGALVHARDISLDQKKRQLAEYHFLQKELGDKQWLASDASVSLADFMAAPMVYMSLLAGLDFQKHGLQKLEAWLKRWTELPGVMDNNIRPGWESRMKTKFGSLEQVPRYWDEVPVAQE